MPEMPATAKKALASSPYQLFTRRVIVPWALQGERPAGEGLEVGAGSGAMTAQLLTAFPAIRMVATDYDGDMVRVARQTMAPFGDRAIVEQADAGALPFEAGRFDFVLSAAMLHHVGDWEKALAEIMRVLRPERPPDRLRPARHRADPAHAPRPRRTRLLQRAAAGGGTAPARVRERRGPARPRRARGQVHRQPRRVARAAGGDMGRTRRGGAGRPGQPADGLGIAGPGPAGQVLGHLQRRGTGPGQPLPGPGAGRGARFRAGPGRCCRGSDRGGTAGEHWSP